MVDKKPENDFDDGFNEDFSFGEEIVESSTPPHTSSRPKGVALDKKVIAIIILTVLLSLSFFAYRFYSRTKTAATLKTNPKVASVTPSPSTPPKPATPSVISVSPTTPPQATTPTKPTMTEGELAAAFSKDNQSSSTIQEFQKELFAPEKTPAIPPTSSEPAPPQPASRVETPTDDKTVTLTKAMDRLSQQMDYNLNQIKYLESYTRELSETLAKLNNTIKTIDNKVSTLTNSTQSLSKDVGSVRNQMGQVQQILGEDALDMPEGPIKPRGRVSAAIAVEEPEFVVHAVIPGRAWLKSSKGQIITVTEGDALGNYGKVVVIDAANAAVLTSSGVSFR